MSKLSANVKEALNSVKFPSPTGVYRGPLLGDLIEEALDSDPISVLSGSDAPDAGAGVAASPGDLYRRDAIGPDGGQLWVKTGDANTAWSLVNTSAPAVGDNLGNHTATMDLDMAGWDINGVAALIAGVADGASAVGFTLDTANDLATEGSKLFSLKNDGVEWMSVRRGADLWADPNSTLFELKDILGNQRMQFAAGDFLSGLFVEGDKEHYLLSHVNDFDYPAGYGENYIYSGTMQGAGAASFITLSANKDEGGVRSGAQLSLDARQTAGGNLRSNLFVVLQDGGTYLYLTSTHDKANVNAVPFQVEENNDITLGPGGVGVMSVNFGMDHYGRLFGRSVQGETWGFKSGVFDGFTAIAYDLDTSAPLGVPGAKLLSLKNANSEMFAIDKDGIPSTGGLAGVSGSFTTTDLKTVTVTNGIITSIA